MHLASDCASSIIQASMIPKHQKVLSPSQTLSVNYLVYLYYLVNGYTILVRGGGITLCIYRIHVI